MINSTYLKQLAKFLRRFPKLLLIPYYIYRFFQTKYTLGVVGIVFNNIGHVLLVEHVFHPKIPWGLPGGWLGRNENPERAVEREFQEELGLTIKVVQTVKVDTTDHNHINIAYLCEAQGEIQELSYELLDYHWWDLKELPLLHGFQYEAIKEAARFVNNEE